MTFWYEGSEILEGVVCHCIHTVLRLISVIYAKRKLKEEENGNMDPSVCIVVAPLLVQFLVVQCNLQFALCTLCFAHCTLYFAICTLHLRNLYFVLFTLWSALCTLYSALCTLHWETAWCTDLSAPAGIPPESRLYHSSPSLPISSCNPLFLVHLHSLTSFAQQCGQKRRLDWYISFCNSRLSS